MNKYLFLDKNNNVIVFVLAEGINSAIIKVAQYLQTTTLKIEQDCRCINVSHTQLID